MEDGGLKSSKPQGQAAREDGGEVRCCGNQSRHGRNLNVDYECQKDQWSFKRKTDICAMHLYRTTLESLYEAKADERSQLDHHYNPRGAACGLDLPIFSNFWSVSNVIS